MPYYTQNFMWGTNGNTTCFGQQNAHNHDHSNQFTKDVKNWLARHANWVPVDHIRTSSFQSNQPKPEDAKEFKWSHADKKWVKA